MQNIYELMANPSFDLQSLKRFLICSGELVRTRTYAYSFAKQIRNEFPSAFVRVLKVLDCYFVIINKGDYSLFWEARKLAMRNERRMKNEIVQHF